jgi:hypothetical protein
MWLLARNKPVIFREEKCDDEDLEKMTLRS